MSREFGFTKETAKPGTNPRTHVLMTADELVNGDRNNQYGPPSQDFTRIAGQLNALGFQVDGKPIESYHVSVIMSCVKLSRIMWSPHKADHWIDGAGYMACGWDCVEESR